MANSSPRFSEEAENAVSVLRALVSSQKGASTVQSILKDYRELEGGPLMYKKYGFPNADEFLKASGEFIVQGRMGETVVYAKPCKDSAHIMRMVAAQKTTKTKKSGFAIMRQPQMRNGGGYKWNPSAYNQMYKQMPYQANRYPAQKTNQQQQQQYFYKKQYQPQQQQQQSQQQHKYNNPLNAFFQGAPGRYNSVNNRTQGTNTNNNNNNYQPKPLMALKVAPPCHNTQLQNQQPYQQRTGLSETNNNNSSIAKNLNKVLQSPTKSSPPAGLASNDLRHKLNEKGPSQQQQQQHNPLTRQDQLMQAIGQPRSDLSNAAYARPPGKDAASEASNGGAAPVLLLSPARSVNSRLQITKDVIPTAEPVVQPSRYSHPHANSPWQDSGNRAPKPIIAAAPPVPVVELPMLPGRKTLQDRLKSNQKVDSVDLEKISKLATPQSPSSDYEPKSLCNTPVSPLPSSAGREREPFSWNEPHATPAEMLFQYAQCNGYSRPIYKYFKLKNKRIQCRVTVNGSTYSTYPDDYTNEFEGQFAAAQIAIANIRRDEERSSYSICLDSEFEIATKIHQLLVNCPHGMFSKNIPDAFREAHHALLPDNWELIILAHSRMFSQEEVERNTIVFANIEGQSGSDEKIPDGTPEVTSGAKTMSANLLTLPWSEQYWNLYVTNPVSTVEIWARLVGPEYSDQMDALITDIELSMMDNDSKSTRPATIAVGEYYLVSTTDCWYRVRVEEIDAANNACVCFFIDTGDWERVALSEVHTCDPRYLKLPGQSLCFSLDGLEDFGENPKAKRHLDNLISGKVCIGEILTPKDEYEREPEFAFSDARIRLILYDTSSDEDVHLNSILLKHICDDTPVPELNRKSVTTVIITHIDDDGNVYCQLKDTAILYIQKLINNLIQSNALKGKQRGLYKAKTAGEQLLYLVQDEHDKKWYRAALETEESGPFCKMLYVDTGIKRSVNISNIYRLETLSVALSRYPPQAIRTKMFDIPEINDYLLSRLRALLKPGLAAMVKVAACSVLPLVKVYMHLDQNNILVCVNDSIRSEMELEIASEIISEPRISSNGHSNTGSSVSSASGLNNVEPRQLSSPVPSQVVPKLPRFPLPGVGDLFDISVTIASSPNYFIVQPYSYALALNRMMEDLQKYCMSQAKPVRTDRVHQGEVYAGLNNDDGHWYRVLVVNILCGPTLIHVYFCDYGKIRILDSDMLRTLPQELRTLPQQAVKAKLHGVQPTHGDWSTEDAVRFQQLTVDKKFASYIRSIQADEFNQNEEIVELELIDVSTDEDVLVHQILVDEKRAVLTSK